MDFGHMLKTLRLSAKIGLRELSRTINVSPTYLSLVENGKQPPPSAVRIAQIEDALKVPSGYLLSLTDGLDADVSLFVQEVPEATDFLTVAKKNSMVSADFMELTGFLNTYGWARMRQTLEQTAAERLDSAREVHRPAVGDPYLWPFLREELVFDMAHTADKMSFFEEAMSLIDAQTDGLELELMLEGLLDRESVSSTGIGGGVAVPHAYVSGLDRMVVAFFRIPDGLDFDAIDGAPVYIALLLAGPRSSENLHLRLLARIAKLLSHKSFSKSLLEASGSREIVSIFREAEMKIP